METLICKPQKRTIFVLENVRLFDFNKKYERREVKSYFVKFPEILFAYSRYKSLKITFPNDSENYIDKGNLCFYFKINGKLVVPHFPNTSIFGVVCLGEEGEEKELSFRDSVDLFWNTPFTVAGELRFADFLNYDNSIIMPCYTRAYGISIAPI